MDEYDPVVMRVRMAPDVHAALGTDGLAIAGRVPGDQVCEVCGRPLAGAARVNAVLFVDGSYQRLAWVHPVCGVSAVVPVDGAAGRDLADGLTLSCEALLVDYSGGPLPALVLAPVREVVVSDGPGSEHVDVIAHVGLSGGGELVLDLDGPPTARPGWCALVDDAGDPALALVLDVTGAALYEGSVVLPAGWASAAVGAGGCVLYLGPASLAKAGGGGRLDTLRASAAGGRLVGGLGAVRLIPTALTTQV